MSDERREKAEAIAKDIMTVDFGEDRQVTAERIAMMKLQSDGNETNIGGRCTLSVVNVILRHLVK